MHHAKIPKPKQTGNFIKNADMQTDFTGLFFEVPRQRLHCPVKGRRAVFKQQQQQKYPR